MTKLLYIPSLHRPFNQQLKTSKWVCSFIASQKKTFTISQFLPEFYYYLIELLRKEYQNDLPNEFNGLPSDTAINKIYDYLKKNCTKEEFLLKLPNIIKERKTPLEKQIYSTYKAASYYLNLAKEKFGLIDEKNNLTEKGRELLSIKSSFFKISSREGAFYFERILEADFHLFVTHCLFLRLSKKYKVKITIAQQSEFITQYLKVKHFNFTSSSLSNYNIVRNSWVQSINVIDANGNIRKRFNDIINKNDDFNKYYKELNDLLKNFENENFRLGKLYDKRRNLLLRFYKQKIGKGKTDQNFINLHDIKNEMRISSENFQDFLTEFYEKEKRNKSIFFSNTVNSIDTRERFFIRNRPVIKIKIKDK